MAFLDDGEDTFAGAEEATLPLVAAARCLVVGIAVRPLWFTPFRERQCTA